MTKKQNTCACEGACTQILPDGSFEKIDAVIQQWKDRPGALIPVLQEAQQAYGYLSEAVMDRVSQGLGVSKGTVFGVATFYSFFSRVPRGQYLVRVCMGTACYVRGGQQVLDALEKELGIKVGETTEDRLFSLDVGRCFGACGLAPVIMVNDTVHQRVKPSKIRELLAAYRYPARTEGV
ncbi:MAG: NADH-quinone oxidoreductase subunit NuoE [Pontiellaceae bacterium]|jgi:NADH-quinone oxidoreductase E subunit|nr:NADH-quinone oxidoreductase subunit NuoE [Pontiellaceae bacterium]